MAPCTGNQSREDYHLIVNQVRQFLEGRDRELLDSLRQNMESAAEREEFEEAARLRDRLFSGADAGEATHYPGQHLRPGCGRTGSLKGTAADLQLLFVRGGLLIGRKDFFWPQSADSSDEELVRSAIEQFYNRKGNRPKELLVPTDLSMRS